jgi:hypothetical protein
LNRRRASVVYQVVEAETRFPGKAPEIPVRHRGAGWVLLVSSWIMRVVGGLIAGISVGESRSAYTTAHDPGYHGPPWIVLVLLGIIVGVPLGILLVGAGVKTGRYARRHLVCVITSVADLTPGSYVLYLRPFEQDRPASSIDSGGGRVLPEEQILRPGRTHEERLARMFREFGPMVTVGRPGEDLPAGSGAYRFYVTGGDWRAPVRELIGAARVILLGAGPGKGTVWEYVEVLRRGDPRRLVILVSDPRWYAQFRTLSAAEVESALPDLRRRYGVTWQAPVLPGLLPPKKPARENWAYFRAMIYLGIGRPWWVSMATFDKSAERNRGISRRNASYRLKPVLAHLRTPGTAPSAG